jgi:hypothetical protein
VMMITTFTAVATPHALVLPVSHGLLFRQPPSFAAALLPPFPFIALPLSPSITNVIGAYRNKPPANASMQTSRNLCNAALTIVAPLCRIPVVMRAKASCHIFVPWLRAKASCQRAPNR